MINISIKIYFWFLKMSKFRLTDNVRNWWLNRPFNPDNGLPTMLFRWKWPILTCLFVVYLMGFKGRGASNPYLRGIFSRLVTVGHFRQITKITEIICFDAQLNFNPFLSHFFREYSSSCSIIASSFLNKVILNEKNTVIKQIWGSSNQQNFHF